MAKRPRKECDSMNLRLQLGRTRNERDKNNSAHPGQGRKLFKVIPTVLFLCAFILFCIAGLYSGLTVTSYALDYEALPEAFEGYTVIGIADLHGHRFGEGQEKLISAIKAQHPDLIVLLGDIIDKRDSNTENVRELLQGIAGLSPIYAVAGNHEFENPVIFQELLQLYREYGVIYLDDEAAWIEKDSQYIVICGGKISNDDQGNFWIDNNARPEAEESFNILLHHFGNKFNQISDQYNLVLSGHIHGGVVRLFGRGLLGNDISFLPKYDRGVFRKESGSVMALSAGLGDSGLPRFFNRREIVRITLENHKEGEHTEGISS